MQKTVQQSRITARHLDQIGRREYLQQKLGGAVISLLQMIVLLAEDVIPELPFPVSVKDGTFDEKMTEAKVNLFRSLDDAVAVFRAFAGQKVAEQSFASLNYCFLALFRHAGPLAQGDPLATAHNWYVELCHIMRTFRPSSANWATLRGTYMEFKESVCTVIAQVTEKKMLMLAEKPTKPTDRIAFKIGMHCRDFVFVCERHTGTLILGGRCFYIPPTADKVWEILEKLIGSDDPEGYVCLEDSSWQGAFCRTDKDNELKVSSGCVQLLKYIHPRKRGRGNGGFFRLMPSPKRGNVKVDCQ